MKTPNKTKSYNRPLRMVKGLASAAVILSLAACDSETVSTITEALNTGEEVDLNISQNDDGCLLYTSPSPRDRG